MSLDVMLTRIQPTVVFDANVTHNLNHMAEAAGIYKHLWRPEELGITKAAQLIDPLSEGIRKMQDDPHSFMKFNPENGWGTFDRFLPWIIEYRDACMEYPDADVSVSR